MILLALVVIMLLLFMASLSLGSVRIPLRQLGIILTGGIAEKESWGQIVLLFRLPKAITAMLAGAALAVAGLEMQTLFRNPLADPFVLGISSGASLGVAFVVFLGAGTLGGQFLISGLSLAEDIGVVLAATIGAALVMAIVLLASRYVTTMTLLILGLMIGYGTNALVSIMMHFSIAERIHQYVNWTFGSFGGTTWQELRVFVPVILGGLVLAHAMVKPLNALLLGEAYAQSMGVKVQQARVWILLSTALLSGVVVAYCGPIGFVGVAVPHLCRGLFGTANHRLMAPAVTLTGAITALAADLIAQVPGSQVVLPLNAVTALIGAPVVIWVILNRRQMMRSLDS